MKNNLLLLALAASVGITSCGDDKNDNPSPATARTPTPAPKPAPTDQPTRMRLISAKKWILTMSTISTTGAAEIDMTDSMPACELDNLEDFATTGIYTTDEGATKCDSSDPQIQSNGTWTLTKDGTKLQITNGGVVNEMDVAELTATKMVLKQHGTDHGKPYTSTTAFSAL